MFVLKRLMNLVVFKTLDLALLLHKTDESVLNYLQDATDLAFSKLSVVDWSLSFNYVTLLIFFSSDFMLHDVLTHDHFVKL